MIRVVRYLVWYCWRFLVGLGTLLLQSELFISMCFYNNYPCPWDHKSLAIMHFTFVSIVTSGYFFIKPQEVVDSVSCQVSNSTCQVSNSTCRVSNSTCQVSNSTCRVSNSTCRVSNSTCRVSNSTCRVSNSTCRVSNSTCRVSNST